MFKGTSILVLALTLGSTGLAPAKDVYYDIPIRELKLVEGRLPDRPAKHELAVFPTISGHGAVCGCRRPGRSLPHGSWQRRRHLVPVRQPSASQAESHFLLRAPEGKEIKGRLFVSNADASGMDLLRFVVPASVAKPEAKEPFYRAKLAHYDRLLARDIPGGAWFRHQARLAGTELKLSPHDPQAWRRPISLDAIIWLPLTTSSRAAGRSARTCSSIGLCRNAARTKPR